MSNRKHIPLKVQLAAALLQLVDGNGERLIPHSDAKKMTAAQIISLYQRDHYPLRVADGGEDVPWNLTWRLRAEHKRKTATVDQPELGKQRRIRAREQEHKAAMQKDDIIALADVFGNGPSAPCWSVPAKPKHKIQSRPFPKGRKFAGRAL